MRLLVDFYPQITLKQLNHTYSVSHSMSDKRNVRNKSNECNHRKRQKYLPKKTEAGTNSHFL